MMEINHWLLPDGVQDLLPDDTAKLEVIRRSFLNRLRLCGYDQLMPAWVCLLYTSPSPRD